MIVRGPVEPYGHCPMHLRFAAHSLFLLLTYGCGDASGPPVVCGGGVPSMTLGAGEAAFVPVAEGDALQMVRGIQGGCHLPLSFHLAGLDGSRLEARYTIHDLDSGAEHVSSRQFVRAAEVADGCEVLGFPAFLVTPWDLEDRRARVRVTLVDRDGLEASSMMEVVVRWPEAAPPVEDALLCGPR